MSALKNRYDSLAMALERSSGGGADLGVKRQVYWGTSRRQLAPKMKVALHHIISQCHNAPTSDSVELFSLLELWQQHPAERVQEGNWLHTLEN